MKKTLFTLLALGSLAMGGTWNYDITSTLPASPVVIDGTLTLSDWNLSDGIISGGNFETDELRVNKQLQNGTWSLTFKVTNNGSNAITLASFNVEAFLCNSLGNTHASNDAYSRNIDYILGYSADNTTFTQIGKTTVTRYNDSSTTVDENKETYDVDITFTDVVLLEKDASTYLKLTVGNSNALTFGGVAAMSLSVPEPTTATLSLLALAGLAARRRRK